MISNKISKKELDEYIKLYSTEDYLYNMVGTEANERGFLRFQDFFNICMWKSSRPKKRYLMNKEYIEKITKEAFNETNELVKIKLLCSLNGVGIPTASALLSVVYPSIYPIIDIRCLEQLQYLGYDISKNISEKVWIKYLGIMQDIALKFKKTPREIDMALFAMHRGRLDKTGENLYPRKK